MSKILGLVNLRKSFFGVEVLKGIDLSFETGEIHGILGQNGAGKSTLIKILTGVYGHTEGEIRLNGEVVTLTDPLHANRLGIGAAHQEPELIRSFTVAENIVLGREGGRLGLLDRKRILREGREILRESGIDLDPSRLASTLSAAESQLVMLATLLHRRYRLIVLDEPTARLSSHETAVLFQMIAKFKSRGVTILYISHRLNEIQELCDRASVLRGGVVTGTLQRHEINEDVVTRLMIDRSTQDIEVSNPGLKRSEPLLALKEVSTGSLLPTSFAVNAGEVLGLIGPVGSGVEQIEKCLGGLGRFTGSISIRGRAIELSSPTKALENGIVMIPEDRRKKAIFPNLTAAENISMPELGRLSRLGFVGGKAIRRNARAIIEKLGIVPASATTPLKFFSGGNQQKAVVGKWMQRDASVYVFVEPTAGVDVGAIAELYAIILGLARQGAAVILVSTSVKEILSLAETVGVVHHGQIAALGPRSEFTRDSLLALSMAPSRSASRNRLP